MNFFISIWSDIYVYFVTAWPYLKPALTVGIFAGADKILIRYFPKLERWLKRIPAEKRVRLEFALLLIALLYAGFNAWREDHKAMLEAVSERDIAVSARNEIKAQLERTKLDSGFYVQRHLRKDTQEIIKSFVTKNMNLLSAQVPIYLTSSTDNDSSYLMQELQIALNDAGLNALSTGTSPQGPGETGFVLYIIEPARASPAALDLIELLTSLDHPPKILTWIAAMRKGWPPTPDFYLLVTRDQPAPN